MYLSVFVLVSVLLLYLSTRVSASLWTATNYTAECGHGVPPMWLCDPDEFLDNDSYANVTSLLASINNHTEGLILCQETEYKGYMIGAAIVDQVPVKQNEDISTSVTNFGTEVQQSWFGDLVCDNSTLVVLSLNTSKFYLIYGTGTESRLRTHHKQVCSDIQVGGNVTGALTACLTDLDHVLEQALKPMSNTALGYAGVAIVMSMLLFHYWIKF